MKWANEGREANELDDHVAPSDLGEKRLVLDYVFVGREQNIEFAILQCVAKILAHLRIPFEDDG